MALLLGAPNWTDYAMLAITALGVVGVVGLLFLVRRALQEQTAQQERQVEIRLAQRAMDPLRMLAALGRVEVEHPELAHLFRAGDEMPADTELRSRVRAHAAGYVSLADATGWQLHLDQMGPEAALAWRAYFTGLYETTPALQQAVVESEPLLGEEALWLLGRVKTTAAVERLQERPAAEPEPAGGSRSPGGPDDDGWSWPVLNRRASSTRSRLGLPRAQAPPQSAGDEPEHEGREDGENAVQEDSRDDTFVVAAEPDEGPRQAELDDADPAGSDRERSE